MKLTEVFKKLDEFYFNSSDFGTIRRSLPCRGDKKNVSRNLIKAWAPPPGELARPCVVTEGVIKAQSVGVDARIDPRSSLYPLKKD